MTISDGDSEIRYVFRLGDATHIAVGDRINAGTQIGNIGAEGQSADGYLHFETRVRGAHVNPLRFLGNMGLRPWPPPGRLRAVSGNYPPATPCTITADA